MKLYTQSIFLTDYSSIAFTGLTDRNDILPAVDDDKNTLLRSTETDPSLSIDFGSGETRTASAIWLRSEGYSAVTVQADGTTLMSRAIPLDGYLYREFTEADAQHWQLDFTGVGGIYEVYLCQLLLDFNTDGKRPLRWRMPRQVGVFFRAANGDLINFQPFGFGGGRAIITLTWELLANDNVAVLFDVFEAGVARNLQFAVYPAPAERPRHFFNARWENEFAFAHTGRKVSDGQSGSVVFRERDPVLPVGADT
ncbi:MAG: hypothetical protein OXI63_11580 [Candidatus Poribacteria bacterium]|nr:hypothetical protein [Candidatus Poribacteria bacterium]